MRILEVMGPAAGPDGISTPASTWRITTAVRVFGLAVVLGQVVEQQAAGDAGVILIGLGVVACVACACDLGASRARLAWVTLAEGLMVALLIGLAGRGADAITVYLAIPALIAGVGHGRASTSGTWVVTALGLAAGEIAGHGVEQLPAQMGAAVLWMAVGLGGGLLAAHQTRSLRRITAAQAPYLAAHRLVDQLHTLVRQRPDVLDVTAQAAKLRATLHERFGCERSAILVSTPRGLEPVSCSSLLDEAETEAGLLSAFYEQRIQREHCVALPLRVGLRVIGAVVIDSPRAGSEGTLDLVQAQLDEQAIRLETALLVEEVRVTATADERHRLAREIHDGVAQRIVALGYRADEIAEESADPTTRAGAEQLRTEIARLIAELRFSVLDLRQDVELTGGLSTALSDYTRELSAHSPLRVHLTLDEQGERLPRRTEAELLRIAQEAIGNVHRHARAINVWVGLHVSGNDVRLTVEDDGVGGATPRAGHYGMHTMRERAERIDADLEIGARHDGGTAVTVRSRSTSDHTMGEQHDQRLARR